MQIIPSRCARRSALTCALLAALLALPTPLLAQADAGLSAAYPAGAHRGQAAIDALGSELAAVAAAHDTTAAELAQRFLADSSLWVGANGRLFYVDIPLFREDDGQGSSQDSSWAGSSIPTSQAFLLHSNPGANKILYMDFDGHLSKNNSWGHNINFPAYNTSGSASSFSDNELGEIITWWLYVVEDYSSFDVDVTTETPPAGALTKSGGGDQTWGIRCVITQPTSGFGNGIGGIALLNSFNDSVDNPCFAFNKGNNTGSMTVSHETGHTFGLQHDGLNGSAYHPGTGSGETSWGPIMGAPFGKSLVQWSKGDYPGATSTQNDLNVITKSANGVNFVADDHGNDQTAASPVGPPVGCPVPTPGSASGVIERRTDVDAFVFTTTGGTVTVDVQPTSPGGNLDIQLDLLDAGGATLATVNDANKADATVTLTLAAGSYYVLVDGVGKTGVYSDYGCLGQYTVFVTLPGNETLTNLGGGVADGLGFMPQLQISGTPCDGNVMTFNLLLAEANSPAWLFLGAAQLGLPFKGGVLVPDSSPPGAVIPMFTNILGAILITTTWPSGVAPGTEIFLQYWVQDATAPFGVTASDGFRIYTP